jgi:REP element-mobilizing transposase RayT
LSVTATRIIVTGATTAITRRTNYRKAFLAPWDPMVQQIWLYALADAQRETGVAVHHGVCVINHHHLTVTPSTDNLPRFTRQLHHDVSCAINTLLIEHRYDAPRQVFDDRSSHQMRLLDAAAQASHLVYEYNNCVAAGLVQRPEHMPDHIFDFELWKRGFIEVQRPPRYFGKRREETLRLEVTPPPLLYQAFGGDMDRLVYHMTRLADHGTTALREARKRPALGARFVQRLHPWSEPKTLRERGGERVPTFRIGARGILGRETNLAAAEETRRFRREHEEARQLRRAGDHAHEFPFGTYQMRVLHNAAVIAEPSPGAIVTQPGQLLCDVKAQLQAELPAQERETMQADSLRLVEEVRQAVAAEAADICADEPYQPADAKPGPSADADEPTERPVVVRRRFDKAEAGDDLNARRVVTHRDQRRGRPKGAAGRHGADPPA